MSDADDVGVEGPVDDADRRAAMVLEAVVGIATEVALDLEVTWDYAREVFARSLFERAERRYGSAPQVAAGVETSVRAVRLHRKKRREESEHPTPRVNIRRRVLHALDEGPADLRTLEQRVPMGTDVNFARSAVRSLVGEGLVIEEDGRFRRNEDAFEPWYLRMDAFGERKFRLLCEQFARSVGSRLVPKAERARFPAALVSLWATIPSDAVQDYFDELLELVSDFDRRWQERQPAKGEPITKIGGVIAVGEADETLLDDAVSELSATDRRELTVDEEVIPTYRRYLEGRERDDPKKDS